MLMMFVGVHTTTATKNRFTGGYRKWQSSLAHNQRNEDPELMLLLWHEAMVGRIDPDW
jgi:hypothetical protein